jgi:hypothetical protein
MVIEFGAKHRALVPGTILERLAPKKYCQISARQNFPVSYQERKNVVAELICLEEVFESETDQKFLSWLAMKSKPAQDLRTLK